MSIFEKLFGGNEVRSDAKVEFEKSGGDSERWNLKENTRLLNIFVASHRVQVTEEFFDAVVKESGITEQELADMKLSAYGQGLNNEMSVSSNLAYMEGVRDKLVKAIRKMDVGNVQ